MVQLQLCLTVSSHQSLGQGHVVPINSVERVVLLALPMVSFNFASSSARETEASSFSGWKDR